MIDKNANQWQGGNGKPTVNKLRRAARHCERKPLAASEAWR
jgi:hypothetical protein